MYLLSFYNSQIYNLCMTVPKLLILLTVMAFGEAGPCSGRPCNILVMLPMPTYSHTSNFMPIFRELAARGHNVTIVSPFPQKKPTPNITDIVLPNLLESFLAKSPVQDWADKDNIFVKMFGLWMFASFGLIPVLETEELQNFIMETNLQFDLVITETWFVQFPLIAFGHKYNAPVVAISPSILFPIAAEFTGNDIPVSYAPLTMFAFNDRMSFLERAQNMFLYYWEIYSGKLYFLKQQDSIMRKYFKYPGSENLPYISDMLENVSLTIVDHHYALGYPRPHHKNIVEFGGINAHVPEKLPADLQKIMDNAKDGIIYVSFGSYFSLSMLKPFIGDAIINALGKTKRKVLFKMDNDTILENYNYKNIEARKWFPQASILAHPNCKLFITHAGVHGLMEGLSHAVPFVAIPMMGDQKFNAKFIETVGIGEVIDKDTITAEKLSNAINAVLTDSSYREKIKERSAIFKDQPMDILDNVVYWIEYVIRHKGAPHLRPAVLDLYWYQRLMLDVIAFYLLLIFLIVYILVKIIRLFFNLITWMCCSKVSKNKKSKKE
ncbi:hypothetical protein O3M35_003015 [Rhynocoris fuscipes]|uniref:UDP-glucuronosyltransferase n=1 Tax=Rhynocoris fuscipes TaxID=488301 RepID=A0AAW1CHJ9_9HEMI